MLEEVIVVGDLPDPGGGGVVVVPVDPGGTSPIDPGDYGGGYGDECSDPSGTQVCPDVSDLKRRCEDAVMTIYHEVDIPNCNRKHAVGSRDRALCYDDAARTQAAGIVDCRTRFR